MRGGCRALPSVETGCLAGKRRAEGQVRSNANSGARAVSQTHRPRSDKPIAGDVGAETTISAAGMITYIHLGLPHLARPDF